MIILFGILRAQFVMGTILELEVYGKDAELFADSVFSLAIMMDSLWRNFWEGWVSKGETLRVDDLTDSLLTLSILYEKRSGGLFNPFYKGKGKPERLGKGVWFFPKGSSFDPGGIAKGFALDIFKNISESFVLDSFLINFGGSNIYGKGVWTFILPDGNILTIKDVFVSSSMSIRDGKSHIYDPIRGRWVKEKVWGFAAGRSGTETDVLSTIKVIQR